MTDMVRVKLENGAEASVPAGFADSVGLKQVSVDGKPASAYSPTGLVLGPSYPDQVEEAVAAVGSLKGQALNDALTAAGLPTTGSLADRQTRLGEYQAEVAQQAQLAGVGGTPPVVGEDPATPDGNPPVGN